MSMGYNEFGDIIEEDYSADQAEANLQKKMVKKMLMSFYP